MKQKPVEGLPIDIGFRGYDPTNWRNHPDPDEGEFDDDQDRKTPADVVSITGIDPDEEGWE